MYAQHAPLLQHLPHLDDLLVPCDFRCQRAQCVACSHHTRQPNSRSGMTRPSQHASPNSSKRRSIAAAAIARAQLPLSAGGRKNKGGPTQLGRINRHRGKRLYRSNQVGTDIPPLHHTAARAELYHTGPTSISYAQLSESKPFLGQGTTSIPDTPDATYPASLPIASASAPWAPVALV